MNEVATMFHQHKFVYIQIGTPDNYIIVVLKNHLV